MAETCILMFCTLGIALYVQARVHARRIREQRMDSTNQSARSLILAPRKS